MPGEAALLRWAEEVPEVFTFALKAPRRITHEQRLKDVQDNVAEFFRRASLLENKLGPALFQLPPFFRKDLALLSDFLSLMPQERRVVLEFHNCSWFDEEVYAALRAHDVALCLADTDDEESQFISTAAWGYVWLRRTQYDDRASHG
jgi:uncharacterized protein YecE (DUF72 family)